MFIKKDLRKIPRILADAAILDDDDNDKEAHAHSRNETEQASKRMKRDILTELSLARRKAEFKGTMNILCQPSNAPSLRNLMSLSVYDCDIHSLDGIGLFGTSPVVNEDSRGRGSNNNSICCPNLQVLNVGRNPLTTLPDELGRLGSSLKELWCDDCRITGPISHCVVTSLLKLETLYMASNQITDIPTTIEQLVHLNRLCLDRNQITHIPDALTHLPQLEYLMLRNNAISQIPNHGMNPTLKLLHLSSNQIEVIPSSLTKTCPTIQHLYLNSNRIQHIPMNFVTDLSSSPCHLQTLNLSNNAIEYLPMNFVERFGTPDPITGLCHTTSTSTTNHDDDEKCRVYIGQNEFNKINASPIKNKYPPISAK